MRDRKDNNNGRTAKKDVVDGHLDMCLRGLTMVPVHNIAELQMVTSLDMSFNCLTSLPSEFFTLIQLRRLDLSKNELSELPENFGALCDLEHLDLYGNKLRSLPDSFGLLSKLSWLDLKGNRLESSLQAAVGYCTDDTQCRYCAEQAVLYVQHVHSQRVGENKRQKLQQQMQASEEALRNVEEHLRLHSPLNVRQKAPQQSHPEENLSLVVQQSGPSQLTASPVEKVQQQDVAREPRETRRQDIKQRLQLQPKISRSELLLKRRLELQRLIQLEGRDESSEAGQVTEGVTTASKRKRVRGKQRHLQQQEQAGTAAAVAAYETLSSDTASDQELTDAETFAALEEKEKCFEQHGSRASVSLRKLLFLAFLSVVALTSLLSGRNP